MKSAQGTAISSEGFLIKSRYGPEAFLKQKKRLKVFKNYPLISRFLAAVVLPASLGFFFLFDYLRTSLTPTDGAMKIEGLHHPVEVWHDSYGTPNIIAKTDRDAYFALGFKHASDRLWQLEVQRRLSQGRLSELFGASMLAQDITMRTLDVYDAAKRSLPYLGKETVDALTAYAEGINAWVAQSSGLPVEFKLFGIQPEPWTVVDSISWQKVFSLTLCGNMMDEMRRSQLLRHLTSEQMRYIYPYDPTDSPAAENLPLAEHLLARNDSLAYFGIDRPFTGSNAWAVSGRYTRSGSPIIVSDPHLALQLPAIWYAAVMKGDKLDVSGMTLVGLPMVIFGRNQSIAWSGTNLMSDQQDLFIETTSPKQPNKYLDGEVWQPFESHKEKIYVSADFPAFLREKLNPVEIVVRKTKRGPVVSDMQPEADAVASLRWSALDSEDHTVDAFFKVQYASDWNGFRDALSQLKTPGLNFVYADREGNIGRQAAGMIPHRAAGVGIIPLRASKENDWLGYENFDALPSVLNPENGFIVSANEKLAHSADIVISHEWASPARHDRITALLKNLIDEKKLLTISDMEDIQKDSVDLTALDLLPILRGTSGKTQQEREALAVLSTWNGNFSPDSVGATLFATWSYYLEHQVIGPALHGNWQRPGESQVLISSLDRLDWSQLAKVVATNTHGWCEENQDTVCGKELHTSLRKALKQLTKISGTSTVSDWKLGRLGKVEYVHQPLGSVKGLEWLFKRSVHSVTSPNSVNAANLRFDPLKGFTQDFGPSFRQAFELDRKDSFSYMISTGQSGNVMSAHFDDMIKPFSLGQLTRFDVDSRSGGVLRLVPSAGMQK